MGELVAGRPIVQLQHQISPALDLVSYMSLLYRAVPGSGISPELVTARRALPDDVRSDLDLLHGFSGRLLYYMEEPILAIDPLGALRGLTADEIALLLEDRDPSHFLEMALRALSRVHRDLDTGEQAPAIDNEQAWREYLLPALTTASPEDAYALIKSPPELKRRTVSLIRNIGVSGFSVAYGVHLPTLQRARELAERTINQGFGLAFSELTGNRLPSSLVSKLGEIERVTFCPSYYLGCFVSYILYPPNLVVYYGAPEYLNRVSPASETNGRHREVIRASSPLQEDALLEALKALSDSNRLSIVELLSTGELYAQEIVARLGIAQSAVSRHLSLLERACLIKVTPRRGMKYYSLNEQTMDNVASSLVCRCSAD
ncbi:hypothetical protein BH23CHL5_BH23CHL5_05660 [soil metagenome]